MRKGLVLFVFLSIWSVFALAQTGIIKGKVIDATAKEQTGLPGALIVRHPGSITIQSDMDGKFSIEASNGDTLISYFTGYINDTLIISQFDKPILVKLRSGINLSEVEVKYRTTGTELSMKNVMKLETLNERSLMKAACCNLSESFETNPSVDVNFSDAISGAKQIQLLGLGGQYAQITKGNMPYLRGLANAYGLSFIPGTWINSIQLGKGAGSVVNGYESFSGQINTELKDASAKEKLFFNAFGNQNGRNEYNLNLSHKFNPKFSSTLLSHTSFNPIAQDMNGDLFVDIPTGRQYNFAISNALHTFKGFEWQFGGNFIKDDRHGGQNIVRSGKYLTSNDSLPAYLVSIQNTKWDVFSKSGYVFKRPSTSIGLQLNYLSHNLSSSFGNTRYTGDQQTAYANLIFESYISNMEHKYKIGTSYINDVFNENLNALKFSRNESTTGIFGEYIMTAFKHFNLIAGSRIDYNNYYGWKYIPRLHMRFEANDNKTVIRLSGGKAWRTANVLAENMGLLASSRNWVFYSTDLNLPYALKPEEGWNYGVNLTQKFNLDYREGYISLDAYRTDFINQVVIDLDQDVHQVNIYNLNGKSFTNTGQIELGYELLKRFDLKMAYRYVDNQIGFKSGLKEKALISQHKGFINLAYETYDEHWLFDATLQYNGKKRLPNTSSNPTEFQLAKYSPSYYNLMGQITYVTQINDYKFDVYVGIENALNYKQSNPILSSGDPYSKYFDASMVWGPIYGRMLYGGLRFKIR